MIREVLTNTKIFVTKEWLDDLQDALLWVIILAGLTGGVLYILYIKLNRIHEEAINNWMQLKEKEGRDTHGEDS